MTFTKHMLAAAISIGSVSAAAAQPACPSQDFNAFVTAFRESTDIQSAFTVRPLESTRIDGEAMPEPAPVTEFLDGEKLQFPVIGNAETQAKEKLDSAVTPKGEARELKLFVPDTGIQVRYSFRKRADGSCWELYRMENDTF